MHKLGVVGNTCCLDDATPHSLKNSNASLKVKTLKEKRVGVHFLTRNTSKVEGHAGTPRWGLG